MAQLAGTLPAWLTCIAVVIGGYIYLRGGSGQAVSGLTDINRELDRQVRARDATIVEKDLQIAELKSQKDVAVALVPVLRALEAHEERASERHTASINVLDLIAQRLGPEPNGN